jgi:hypothetical protein
MEKTNMSQFTASLLVFVGLLLSANSMLAANFAVGICKPNLPSYASIQTAVSSVPAGSTVEVCPGTYAEQVTIAQPLTLEGVTSGNSSDVVITVPGSGLTGVPDAFGTTIFAMVAANAGLSGPVNLTNITMDGTGYSIDSSQGWLVGIYYPTDSSGTVNEVSVHNLFTTGYGTASGVWLENADNSNTTSLTLENSSFHDINNSSLITNGTHVTATVKGNFLGASGFDIQWDQHPGTVTGNYISSGNCCSSNFFGPATVSGNTFANSTYALETFGFGTAVTSNKFMHVGYAIQAAGSGDTYKLNTITKAQVAIEFYCNLTTVASNTINDATTGLDQVPASFSGANKFYSVGTIRTGGCGSGPTKRAPNLPGKPGMPIPAPAK